VKVVDVHLLLLLPVHNPSSKVPLDLINHVWDVDCILGEKSFTDAMHDKDEVIHRT
jgi:hypothetical protein